jgi:DNA-binding transcriptional regulator PaaX
MKTSVVTNILKEFLKPKFRYKGMRVNFIGLPSFSKNVNKKTFSKEMYRLKQKGLIEKNNGFLRITQKGREYVKRRQESFSIFDSKFSKSTPQNLIVMFDIPETKKAEREWFRFHLKKFNYMMIQKSVWVGPSPLPVDFLNYLNEIELKDCVKTFKLAKAYQSKNF